MEIIDEKAKPEEAEEGEVEEIDSAPVIGLANYMIRDAVRKRASDIHLNCFEKNLVLRFRIDGKMIEFPPSTPAF